MKQHSSKLGCALGAPGRISKKHPTLCKNFFYGLHKGGHKQTDQMPGVKRKFSCGFFFSSFLSLNGLRCSRQVYCSWRSCKCRYAQPLLCCPLCAARKPMTGAFAPLCVKLGARCSLLQSSTALQKPHAGLHPPADLLQLFKTTGVPYQIRKPATLDI